MGRLFYKTEAGAVVPISGLVGPPGPFVSRDTEAGNCGLEATRNRFHAYAL